MHLLDCKGVAAEIAGSILSMIAKMPAAGRNKATRLNAINTHMDAWHSAHPGRHKLPPLLVANLTGGDKWANLSGAAIKAATTRGSVPWLKELVRVYFPGDSEREVKVRQLADDLAEFYELLYAAGRFVPPATVDRLRLVVVRSGASYMWLREDCRLRGELFFKATPKVHKMQHVPLMATALNPRFVQNYSEESLIGTCTKN